MSQTAREWAVQLRPAVTFALILAAWTATLSLLGIGCPIRYLTGVSCPGCGMTRAWLSVLHLHLGEAFAYHPLFWLVPPAVFVALGCKRSKTATVCAVIAIIGLAVVWVVRLLDPNDLALLPFSPLSGDVVHASLPPWLVSLTHVFA